MTSLKKWVCLAEEGGVVFVIWVLHLLPVVWFDVGVWLVLRLFWRGLIKSDQRVLAIIKHGEVEQSCGVVPIEVNPKEAFAAPIMLNDI